VARKVGTIALEKHANCFRVDPKYGGIFFQYTAHQWYLHLIEGIFGQVRVLACTSGLEC
jgi:hypothetical protein